MSEQIVIGNPGVEAPSQEDQKHIDEMVAKADKALEDPNKPAPTKEGEPEKLFAGKYKTVEEMEKGYLELQKLASRKNANKEEGEVKPNVSNTPEGEAKQTLEKAGLDFDKYSNEIVAEGVLSEDSYKELESKGFPKSMVDAYVEGQKALAEKTNQSIYEVVGGQQAYTEMLQWAAGNLSQEEIDSFNATIEAGDVGQMKMAVRGLKASYAEANGTPPKQLLGGYSAAAGGVDSYASWAQVTEDMKNPKYQKDPAFRATVQARLGRSKDLM